MLEHVALHQTRFNTPGVAPDTRGILLGKQGAVLFASVDKLVGFFRILSEEAPLDDLLPTLKLLQVKTPLGSREFLVLFHAASSYLVDRAARIATLLGGLTFTGSGKHFVKYRDEASPLGYDVAELASEGQGLATAGAEFILYADAFTEACSRVKEIPFSQLVFRLSPRPIPGEGPRSQRRGGGQKRTASAREVLWLVVQPGLATSVLTYLWRNRVAVEAALVSREGAGGAFDQGGRYLLARVHDLPERILALYGELPGIEVHRPIGPNFVVEAGFRHPLRLESCHSVFDKEKFYVFSGRRDSVDVIAAPGGALPLTDGEKLVAVGFDLGERGEPVAAAAAPVDPLRVTLKLVPSNAAPRRVTATLVPWAQLDWLKKLVFTLPPTVLSGYRVAPVDDGLLVLGEQGVDGLPLGEMFQEAAPSIFIPVGFEFLPRVSEAVLSDHVGGVHGRVVVFRRRGGSPVAASAVPEGPFAVDEGSFEPLGRRVLGRMEVETRPRSPRGGEARPPALALVQNDALGPLPLWGFRGGDVPEDP